MMRRALIQSFSQYTRNFLSPPASSKLLKVFQPSPALLLPPFSTKFSFFSSDNGDSSVENPKSVDSQVVQTTDAGNEVEDISNEGLKKQVEAYFKGDNEEDNLSSLIGTILARRLYNKDKYFNMDDTKWDEIVKDGITKGYVQDTKEMEDILEDMLNWNNLLPDDIKKKVEAKFDELGGMCERQELEPEEAYKIFKEFEDNIVMEYMKQTEEEGPPQFDEEAKPDKKVTLDDPPGEGPILQWQSRVIFGPGGDAWHPKNRKVKLSVTVKDLGLSKHQFVRMREIVGKRHHPGRDELTITSERFEHREENRKDCLRTLLNIIEEAGKANKMAEAARASYVKDRLRANPQFMARLHAKTQGVPHSAN
ncbi:hypothetical protein Dimus_029460 [Dionaea muscipula]